MIERRKYERVTISVPAKIILDDQTLESLVQNLSLGGGLLSIVSPWNFNFPFSEFLGKRIFIEMEEMKNAVEAQVVRIYEHTDNKIIAVQIEQNPDWKKFWFRKIKAGAA